MLSFLGSSYAYFLFPERIVHAFRYWASKQDSGALTRLECMRAAGLPGGSRSRVYWAMLAWMVWKGARGRQMERRIAARDQSAERKGFPFGFGSWPCRRGLPHVKRLEKRTGAKILLERKM